METKKQLIYKDDARAAILKENPSAAYCIDRVKVVDAVEIVRCKDCKYRGNDIYCPMCFEEQIEYDDDGYMETDYIMHDHSTDNGFCDRGEMEDYGI